MIALRPAAPYASLPLAYLRLGEAHDRLGAARRRIEAYRAAIAAAPSPDPYDVKAKAAERLRRAPDPRRADAYRLSLEGWRRLEHNDLPSAAGCARASLALNGSEPVARYRFGRVLQARKDDAARSRSSSTRSARARNCPPPILGAAYLEAARLHERLGRRRPSALGTTARRRRCSAPPPTRAPPPTARSRVSNADLRHLLIADFAIR